MEKFPYQDILQHSYPDPEVERDFPHKVLREAQFAPFAALTGHQEAVAETARVTQRQLELSEDVKAELDGKIRMLCDSPNDAAQVLVTYFRPDERKAGGTYLAYSGIITHIKDFERKLVFADGTEIPMEDVVAIEGDLLDESWREDGGYGDLQNYGNENGEV